MKKALASFYDRMWKKISPSCFSNFQQVMKTMDILKNYLCWRIRWLFQTFFNAMGIKTAYIEAYNFMDPWNRACLDTGAQGIVIGHN